MPTVTVSPQFRGVIPCAIREALSLEVGQKLEAMQAGDQIVFVPVRSAKTLRRFMRGIDTAVVRDRDWV